ncbi:MAG: deoxyguanosinetriphosphate triphosphohydrolase [Ruminococcaceae bacterium]|nr:deoxyguanosinetriphosphate triphosphohydrolase [Oscillospiraceae bacterium]
MSIIKQKLTEREKSTLSPYAFLSESTAGREHPCTDCDMRTDFQRDRDRIIHSQSFRRLMYKTQVFLAPAGDHYRTRLTHTLEVTQIARTIARALFLNEDLTEAIALGHDLGHTPFGHAGEVVMRQCFSPDFSHNLQGVRVVEKLENNGNGLNLTAEVRDGIAHHSGKEMPKTLEGCVIRLADRIAYINHDIDDALRAGILQHEEIPADLRQILGNSHGERINTMVSSVVRASTDRPEIVMEPEVWEATDRLRDFLFLRVYRDNAAKDEEIKAKDMLAQLFDYFENNPDKLPLVYLETISKESVGRAVCDYLSGMTDRYAIELYRNLFIPEVWRVK